MHLTILFIIFVYSKKIIIFSHFFKCRKKTNIFLQTLNFIFFEFLLQNKKKAQINELYW